MFSKVWKIPCRNGAVFQAYSHSTTSYTPLFSSRTAYSPKCSDELGSFFKCVHTTSSLEATTSIKMPSLSPTMTEGTIVKWNKKEGDPVGAGDVLCEIQTDKAVVSLDVDDDGVLAKIIMPENSANVQVGTLIALMVEEGDDWKNVEIPETASQPLAAKATGATETPTSSQSVEIASTKGVPKDEKGQRLLGPAVRNYLAKYGLQPSQVPGNGPHGAVTKADVIQYALANKVGAVTPGSQASVMTSPSLSTASVSRRLLRGSKKAGPATFKEIEITNMRKVIAKRLLQSKSTVPHAYGTIACKVENLMSVKRELSNDGAKVSVNDIIIKCAANALLRCPQVNVVWEGETLKQYGQVDISVAVATPNGLITPIVTNAGNRGVQQISESVRELAAKAREGKLQPHEFMGGSFSISNLGMFGIHNFSAIINPPQCAILAIGGTIVSADTGADPQPIMNFTMSYDGSAIITEDAMKFLAVFKSEIENASIVSVGAFNALDRNMM